ncbi:MAG: TetR/AcrR family transcriptional regulator [Halorientalis sp.]
MPDDACEDILDATYRALCDEGYAALTMQDIADRTDRSKAALHYHFDSKRDLLLAFLEYLYGDFTDRVGDPPGETAPERLDALVDRVLGPHREDPERRRAFGTALLELTAQAPYDEEVRERLAAFDAFLLEQARAIIADGVAEGSLRDVDPEETARFLVTALDGARLERVSVGRDAEATGRAVRSYVRTHLVADDDAERGVARQ